MEPDSPHAELSPDAPAHARRTMLSPYFVLAVTLALTAGATLYAISSVRARDRLRFENHVRQTRDRIQNRLDTYVTLLRAGGGLFAASERVTREEFHAYIERLELRERYPGVQGIGYAVRLRGAPERDARSEATRREEGFADFRVRPEGERAEYYPVFYIEPPEERNLSAVGYDMFSEPVRRAAMERARDTGTPAATGRVTLIWDTEENKQAGFLIYAPVYRGGQTPATEAARAEALEGFIYSPFRAGDLLRGIFGEEPAPPVGFEVFDGEGATEENLLHRSDATTTAPAREATGGEQTRGGGGNAYRPRFTAAEPMEVAGRRWTLRFASRPAFDAASGWAPIPLLPLAGSLISFLLFAVTHSQSRARTRAEQSAAELRRADQALRESEERYRSVAETASDAIITIDAGSTIVFVNATVEGVFGYSAPEVLGQNLTMLMPDYLRHLHRAGVERYAETGRKHVSWTALELPGLHRDGHEIPLEISFGEYEQNGRRYFTGIVRDVTERKRAEGERAASFARERQARQEAEEANRLKDEFLATLSHELRTPMTSILGWSRLLRTEHFDASVTARAYETIERNARAQTQLIDDLLDVSRIITGKLRLDLGPVDLAGVIGAAVETARPAAAAKDIRLSVVLDRSAGHVSGDPNRLQQVIWNLLTNAVKFTPDGGRVEVRLKRAPGDGARAEVSVSDTGQGIAPEFLPHVFERFRQADGRITRTHGGLGLGLSIARHLVELHGGTISAESDGERAGSTFRIRLPLLLVPAAAAPPVVAASAPGREGDDESGRADDEFNRAVGAADAAADESPGARGGVGGGGRLAGVRVLVVDDDEDTRQLLSTVLAQHGARVSAVSTVAAALARVAQDERPDVIVSDIGMPDEDGYDFVRRLRELPPERGGRIPAAALTAYARPEDRARALASGYQAHVAKPVEPESVVEVVARLARANGDV